jgi:PAS domain S-box-containing protein
MHERPALSIRQRLLAILVATVLAVILLHDTVAYANVRRSALDGAYRKLTGGAEQLRDLLQSSAGQIRAQTLAIARDTAVTRFLAAPKSARKAAVTSRLDGQAAAAAVLATEVWDASGATLVAGSRGAAPFGQSTRADVLAGLTRGDSVAVGAFVRDGDILAYPVIARARLGSKTAGYVVQWRRVDRNAQARQQLLNLMGGDLEISLGSPRGVWTDLSTAVTEPPVSLPATGPLSYRRAGLGERLAVARDVPGTPWTLVVESPRDRALAPVRTMVRELAGVTVLLLALGAAAASLLTGRLTSPLGELASAASAVSRGDYSQRVSVRRRDEVGQLAETFNTMAENVASARDRLSDALEAHARVAAELDAALASSPVGFAFYDRALRFRRVNHALAAFTGVPAEAHVGRTVRDVMPSLHATIETHLRRVLATGECVFDVEFSGETGANPGVVRHWVTTYYPIRAGNDDVVGVGSVVSDRTAYKALEHQFRHAQKMEAVGRLAGGVAHDFNNILTAVTNYSQFLLDDLDAADPRRDDVAEISKAADRASALVRQLLAFSRQQVLQPRPLDLNVTVRDLAPMLARLIGAQVQLETRLDPGLDVVCADPGQIEQVLVNLVVNASDAMPDGGTLTIETANAELDEEYARHHADAVPGRYVVLSVSDTGTGMSPDTQARIFEPFFTTKEMGKGTGLGLATVYGIVKQSGGNIWVYSEPEHGTRFRIYLPRSVVTADDAREIALPAPLPNAGTGTVLLVEDNDAIRAVARRTLSRCGYTVLEATNGTDALSRYDDGATPIDLLLTDLVMPHMGGRELAARVRERHAGARVLFMSGFTHDTVVGQNVLEPSDVLLEKPFTPEALARKVRELLEPAATGNLAA